MIPASSGAVADADGEPHTETGETTLSFGSVEVVRLLLAAGANPNRVGRCDFTPLMTAVDDYFGKNLVERVAMVRLLIQAGADVNATTSRGKTSLGCSRGENLMVQILMEAGARIGPCGPGEEPLLLQVLTERRPSSSREAGILRLIAAGAEVNVVNSYGLTPLKRACAVGSRRLVAALLKSGARRIGMTPCVWDKSPELHLAAEAGEPQVVQLLLDDGADIGQADRSGRPAIYRAADNGRAEVVRVLLAAGADPSAGRERGLSSLRAAAFNGHVECISVLLGAGVDVDARTERGVSALHLASLMRRLKVIPQLVQAGASVDSQDADGRTPLMWAVQKKGGREKARRETDGGVELLLALGADPYRVDHRGQTVLFDAARACRAGEIERFLALGLDAKTSSHDGVTPLMILAAAYEPDIPAAQKLLAAGARSDAVDRFGASCLHYALRPLEPPVLLPWYWRPHRIWASSYMLELLLKAGAKVDLADEEGRTPLMLAAQQVQADFISLLLQAGADPDARDRSGRSARDYAEAAGRAWP